MKKSDIDDETKELVKRDLEEVKSENSKVKKENGLEDFPEMLKEAIYNCGVITEDNIIIKGIGGDVKLPFIKKEEKSNNDKIDIILPKTGKLMSEFALEVGDIFKDKEEIFYRPLIRDIVEVSLIKEKDDNCGEEKEYLGFSEVTPSRFITLCEEHFNPVVEVFEYYERKTKIKSMSNNTSNIILQSNQLRDKLPNIKRIFQIPIPIIYKGKLTFNKKGYDERFKSFTPYNSPEIEEIELEEAKKIINEIFGDFCFQDEEIDFTNAIAGLLTPFLRGLFPSFNTRTPVFIYTANRERAGKDYCAGITGLVYEGSALEEPPISTGDKFQNNNDELRKKFLSALVSGRKRLHFSNNKGYINNSVLEGFVTCENFSDRVLGKNQIINLPNEIDVSLSGNIGIGYTPDLINRSRFVRLFLAIENANEREFKIPNLHEYIKENRSKILSALYSLVKNWYDKGMPKGSVPFASFPEWSRVCGGIMECAGYGNPCKTNQEILSVGGDTETSDMKALFELAYSIYPNQFITKKQIEELIKEHLEDYFIDIDLDTKSGQTKLGNTLKKFVGRYLSDILMKITNLNVTTSRAKFMFSKIDVKKEEKIPEKENNKKEDDNLEKKEKVIENNSEKGRGCFDEDLY